MKTKNRLNGLQAWLSRKTGISQSHLSHMMSGRQRVPPEKAAIFEPLLLQKGINLTRIDLVFGYRKGQSWQQLLATKERDEK